jgi:hypothetical protein
MIRPKRLLLTTLTAFALAGGCTSFSTPANYRDAETRFWALIDPDRQKQILREQYDRARLLKEVGPPNIDDGEEWVYVGKFQDTTGIEAGMLMAITASLDDPTWKTAVVTFSRSGVVEAVNVSSTPSAIAERQKRGILLGQYYNRDSRLRATTGATTAPGGGGK